MGNCLVLQEKKVIKMMRMDGEIQSYKSPLKVQQGLNEFPGHAVSDELPAIRYLDSMSVAETGAGAGVIRIKLVLTKQELKDMLRKGEVSHGDMISFLQREESKSGASDRERCMEWRPTLESIPEGDDFR